MRLFDSKTGMRNPVAKNEPKVNSNSAGPHVDKKKKQKRGEEKHKGKEIHNESIFLESIHIIDSMHHPKYGKVYLINNNGIDEIVVYENGELVVKDAGEVKDKWDLIKNKLQGSKILDKIKDPKYGLVCWIIDHGRHQIVTYNPTGEHKVHVEGNKEFISQKWAQFKASQQGVNSKKLVIDSFKHPKYGKVEWIDKAGDNQIVTYTPEGRTIVHASGVRQNIAGQWADLKSKFQKVSESATPGATSSGSIATVVNPQLSPGPARGKKSYIGSPGKSGTKAPPQPKAKQPKTKMGTAVSALDMNTNIFGSGAPIKRKG